MDIKVNTDELLESSETYLKTCREIESILANIYADLEQVFLDGSWQGVSAMRYQSTINAEKEDLEAFVKAAQEYGKILKEYAERTKALASKYRR